MGSDDSSLCSIRQAQGLILLCLVLRSRMHGAVPICLHDVMLYKHKVNLTLPVPITL